jgi:uncharacterized protein (TIGR03000 family)
MKKFVLIVAVAAMALLVDTQLVSAGRCGGGRRGGRCHSSRGCGQSSYGCGQGGGCDQMGGCGSYSGCSMGYSSGCQTCGSARVMGGSCATGNCGSASLATCANGVCSLNGAVAQAESTGATLVVTLPADAKLTIDDEPTTSTTGNRVFVTPALENGKVYQYTLKAQVVREGKTQTTTAQVTVRAGQVSSVELSVPATGVAAQ